MNNYQMFRKIQERDNIIKKYSNDTKEDLIDLVIEKDNIIENLQFKIDKAIEYVNTWLVDEYSICVSDKKEPDVFCHYESDAKDKLLDILKEDK